MTESNSPCIQATACRYPMSEARICPGSSQDKSPSQQDDDVPTPLYTSEEPSPPTRLVSHSFAQGSYQETSSNICQQTVEPMDIDDIPEPSSSYPLCSKAIDELLQQSEEPKAGRKTISISRGTSHPHQHQHPPSLPSPAWDFTLAKSQTSLDNGNEQLLPSKPQLHESYSSAVVNGARDVHLKAAALKKQVCQITESLEPLIRSSTSPHQVQKDIQELAQELAPSDSDPAQKQRQHDQSFPGGWDKSTYPSLQNQHVCVNEASYPSLHRRQRLETEHKTLDLGEHTCHLPQMAVSISDAALLSATHVWADAGDGTLGKHEYSPDQPPMDDSKRLKPNESYDSFPEPFTPPLQGLDYDASYDKYIALSEPHRSPSFQNKVPHGPWKMPFKADEFPNNLKLSSSSSHRYPNSLSFSSSLWSGPPGSEVSDTDLKDLPVAPWCGTDLVGHPSEWFGQSTQARTGDDRHRAIESMPKNEQWLSTHRVPRLRKKYLRQDSDLTSGDISRVDKTTIIPERSSTARLTCLNEMSGDEGIWSPQTRSEFHRVSKYPSDPQLARSFEWLHVGLLSLCDGLVKLIDGNRQ